MLSHWTLTTPWYYIVLQKKTLVPVKPYFFSWVPTAPKCAYEHVHADGETMATIK